MSNTLIVIGEEEVMWDRLLRMGLAALSDLLESDIAALKLSLDVLYDDPPQGDIPYHVQKAVFPTGDYRSWSPVPPFRPVLAWV